MCERTTLQTNTQPLTNQQQPSASASTFVVQDTLKNAMFIIISSSFTTLLEINLLRSLPTFRPLSLSLYSENERKLMSGEVIH